MINLLLPEDKQKILGAYRRRLAAGYGAFAAVGLALALGVMASAYAGLRIERSAMDSVLAAASGSGASSDGNAQASMEKMAKLAAALSDSKAGLQEISPIIADIAEMKPAGIRVSNIEIAGGGGSGEVKIRGTSDYRAAIIAFTDALKADKRFANVDSPFSNLIKEGSSAFAITLSLSSSSSAPRRGSGERTADTHELE